MQLKMIFNLFYIRFDHLHSILIKGQTLEIFSVAQLSYSELVFTFISLRICNISLRELLMFSIFFPCSWIMSSVFFLPSATSQILWFKFWNSTLLATFSSAIESASLARTLPEVLSVLPEHTYESSVRDCKLNWDHSAQTYTFP